MLNITRDTGEFLVVLVRATAARRVLEIGVGAAWVLAARLGWACHCSRHLIVAPLGNEH